MIRKFISRVLGRCATASSGQLAVIAVVQHGCNGTRSVAVVSDHRHAAGERLPGVCRRRCRARPAGGLTPKDFDVATNATPEQVRHCFRRSRIIGRRFQIRHVNMGAETIEVTTFRGHHGEQGGNTAQTDEQGRVLRDNVFGSQAEDAARRDFTRNAL
ncbi:MAG: hypothetical protein IPL11_06720 [Candidatus Accumulibacter sp.]|nr:hypothetical protein [Accumulibacter sp.]